jgi:hypothetical protein
LDEEKSKHVGLAQQNGFGPAFLRRERERERVRAEKIIINKQAREKEERKKERKKGFIFISSGLAMYGATPGKQQHTSTTCKVGGDPDDDEEEEEDSSQQHQQRKRRGFCCRCCCCGGCRSCCRSSSSNYATNVSECVIVPHHPRSCQILSHPPIHPSTHFLSLSPFHFPSPT